MEHAKESGHWYTREGEPAYTVKSAKGEDRPTTLRDARKHNLVPSVTTILNVYAKPGLEIWKQKQVLMSALTLGRNEGETDEDWMARIINDSKEIGREAADLGTAIHAAIQGFYEGTPISHEFVEIVHAADKVIKGHFNDWEWIAEHSFSHELGFAGKCDLYIPASEKMPGFLIDIKTKDFGPDDKITPSEDHLMQLSAYRVGLGMQRAKCANVYVSRSQPGVVRLIEWSQEDLDRGWQMFLRLLEFWQLKTGHK